jgi:hypothetical protein
MAAGGQEQTATLDLVTKLVSSIDALRPKVELREGDPEYVERQRKEGWFDDFDGGIKVFQNAYEAQPRGLSAEVRYRAAHLAPGKYIRGRVTVDVNQQGVHLKYPVSGDAMLINRDYFRDFSDLVNQIWAEMQAKTAA